MNFISSQFAVFFFFVLVGFYSLRSSIKYRNWFLLFANIIFYSTTGFLALIVVCFSAFINWFFGSLIFKNSGVKAKTLLIFACIVNLSLLAFFKYYELFFDSVDWLFSLIGISVGVPSFFENMIFLSGISFFTFQGISYCVDLFKGTYTKNESFWNVLTYLSFFPTVLAGPIMRPGQFFPQLEGGLLQEKSEQFNEESTITAFALIISGAFKKIVLASFLSDHIVHNVFQDPGGYSSLSVLFGVYGYTVQIFCDFSGYSDLAIGVGLLLGFNLPQNFLAPYLAFNLQDFWRRWHITLSSWLRDYLYIPLGGSRRGNQFFNLFITMILGGLWHGAHIRFLIWGALHGAGLCVVHFFNKVSFFKSFNINSNSKLLSNSIKIGSWLLTLHFVAFTWIFFRAENMDIALDIIYRIVNWGQDGNGFNLLVIPAIIAGIAIQYFGPFIFTKFVNILKGKYIALQAVVVAIILVFIRSLGPDGVLPFIYFQF